MAGLEAQRIVKAFGPTKALNGVDFSAEPGRVHALIGENGSGKSTLMRILSGEHAPDSGSLLLEGSPFAPADPKEALARGVTLVHQELAICPHLTITENLFLGCEIRSGVGLHRRAMRREARDVFAQLGHEHLDVDGLVSGESVAVRQLIDIARAVRAHAKVILFDEPTTSLGAKDTHQLFLTIRRLRDEGRAIVYITHFLDEVRAIADEGWVLRDGDMVGRFEVAETSTQTMAEMMTGRTLDVLYPGPREASGPVVLEIDGLSGRHLPKGVSLQLREGEVLGIAGLNGSGRSETLRCVFGLDASNRKTSPSLSWSSGMGMVSEDRKGEGLALNLSLSENLVMPKPGKKGVISRRDQARRTSAVIDAMNVKCRASDQAIRELSGGNQQKIAIGRLLDQNSHILLLDEPTKGIDIGAKELIYAEIDRLAREGKSIIIVSSYLPELLGLCDRIAVLRRGELVAVTDARQTSEKELMGWCAGA